MTELKTLKDLFDMETCLEAQELRQEAIKWAKEKRRREGFYDEDFMEFFNITEDDLK